MQGPEFDETEFFRAIAASGARALLIGRQALVALGLPVITADYDFWLHQDDIERFHAAVLPFELIPSRSRADARATRKTSACSSRSAMGRPGHDLALRPPVA